MSFSKESRTKCTSVGNFKSALQWLEMQSKHGFYPQSTTFANLCQGSY